MVVHFAYPVGRDLTGVRNIFASSARGTKHFPLLCPGCETFTMELYILGTIYRFFCPGYETFLASLQGVRKRKHKIKSEGRVSNAYLKN